MTKDDRDFIAEEEEEDSWKNDNKEMNSPDEDSQDNNLDDYVDKVVDIDVEELD